jgi:hypothetical protein
MMDRVIERPVRSPGTRHDAAGKQLFMTVSISPRCCPALSKEELAMTIVVPFITLAATVLLIAAHLLKPCIVQPVHVELRCVEKVRK